MQILNQLKIGDIVYDLAAKYDSNNNNIKDTYIKKDEMPLILLAVKEAENVNATITEENVFEVTDRTGAKKTLDLNVTGGTSAGFGEIAATVDNSTGTPSVTVTTSGTNEEKNFTFEFTGLKGEKGEVGMLGNSGVADASNKTLVNDAITGGETDFLSAEVGKLGILTYDCSKGGSVTHTTLQDAINSVPITFQKVGLTITYKSEDTIYRYTLKANSWSANPANWFSLEDKLSDLEGIKMDRTSIAQTTGDAEDKVMSQKATTTAIEDETTRAKAAEQAIIFDVSVQNSGAVFESLSALLSSPNLSTLIPTSVRHGGMSIQFIQGSEHQKYEQYRLMRDSWSTVVTDWQGVDDKPVYKSDNLAKSGSLYSLSEEAVGYDDFEDIKGRLSVAYDKAILQNGVIVSGEWFANSGFITTPLQVYKNDIVKITANYNRPIDTISIDNGDGTYITVATGNSSGDTLKWTASKDCKVVFSGNDWSIAEIYLLRASKVETKVNNIVWKKRIIDFNINLTPGMLTPTKITLGQTFPFGGHSKNTNILRGIFEVKEGEKVYFSTLPFIQDNFSGYAVLDKDYIVISLTPASNEIYFEVPAGGKYVVFQTLTASGYPTIYVESLENTTEEIDTTDLELLQNPTTNCLQNSRAYIFGDIGTKVTESDNWKDVYTTCYSCVPGDVFYITVCTDYGAFAVVSENNVILAKDTRPIGFWHYMTKVVVPEGGAKLLVNNNIANLCVYKKKATRNIYPEKEPIVAAASLATVGSNYSNRRLRLSWASDTHGDNNLYKRWIDWTNRHIGMFDAALHTGDFNRMADADNGFVVTALKYRTILPFLPTLGNHDCFGQTPSTNTLNSGSLEWNGNKYIKPFVENDSACVVSNDGCYYYRDFTDKKIRMIVINDYDKPRWADGTYWITTTDEAEIASAVEWTSGKSYAVGDVVHYKGMYVKCKTAGNLDDNAHVWRPDKAVLSKTITDCRYINQAQADFIVNAMNVGSGWGIIFVTHQPYEALPASEHCISKWTLRRDLVNTYVGVKFGQNGYMIQDLITAYLNKTTLNKTYECITPNVNPLASNVVKTNLPDFYPDVTIDVDFTNAVGDVICCLNGHQHSDTAYWSQHTGEKKVLCIGAPTNCYLPFDSWSDPWPSGDIAKNVGAKDCFNAISIDTTEKAVYLVRIGADKTDQLETRDYIRISYAHN